ncbi:hypothetical protein ACHAWU_008302 [Discostella pseudostelligera]|uniref:ShKT domain-containing protein n=1 Tax=Discostella pseudostelligera TaxID=259834 RepID=A0ABD3M494_9STRA
MPHASDLEEFGLEVEHEHHALMGSSSDAADMSEYSVGASSSSLTTHRRAQHIALSTPSKEQRSLLQSINVRPPRLLRPGMFKWATLMIGLALVVFLNLGQESEEANYFEEGLPDIEICEDDDIAFSNMFKSESDCATFVKASSNEDDMTTRCNQPIGIPDENEFQMLLKHFCRKSCGLCGIAEDAQVLVGENSEANIEAAVQEIAGEIEEKELEVKIEKEKEQQSREKELEKEIAKELNVQEEEQLAQSSAPESTTLQEDEEVPLNIQNTSSAENGPTELSCQDETTVDKVNCTHVSILSNTTLRNELCNSPIDETDEENESDMKAVKHICRKSCGLCDDSTDIKGAVDSVGEEKASGHEEHNNDESDSTTARVSSKNKSQNGDAALDVEVEQSNNADEDDDGGANDDAGEDDNDDESDSLASDTDAQQLKASEHKEAGVTSKNKLQNGDVAVDEKVEQSNHSTDDDDVDNEGDDDDDNEGDSSANNTVRKRDVGAMR